MFSPTSVIDIVKIESNETGFADQNAIDDRSIVSKSEFLELSTLKAFDKTSIAAVKYCKAN